MPREYEPWSVLRERDPAPRVPIASIAKSTRAEDVTLEGQVGRHVAAGQV